jgi:L-lysine exporter family protein LysE/ArgO
MSLATPAVVGFATSFSLILAIGAQNTFVLRQGLMKSHVFAVCLVCGLSDAIRIAGGVAGFGALVTTFPRLLDIILWAGAAFLFVYGLMRFRAAWTGSGAIAAEGATASLAATLATCLALTWLNPHVYLDTFALIGSISAQYKVLAEKLAFGAGAIIASFVFFFSLGYGSRLLAPLMISARAWIIFDILVGAIMWLIAFGLIASN